MNKKQWISTVRNLSTETDVKTLCRWAYSMIEASSLKCEEKFDAIAEAMEVIHNEGLRGDISDKWIQMGFSNEQFNYQLFL